MLPWNVSVGEYSEQQLRAFGFSCLFITNTLFYVLLVVASTQLFAVLSNHAEFYRIIIISDIIIILITELSCPHVSIINQIYNRIFLLICCRSAGRFNTIIAYAFKKYFIYSLKMWPLDLEKNTNSLTLPASW